MTTGRAPNVGAVDEAGVVYAAVLPDGPILVLTDGAAEAWRWATGTDDRVPAGLDGYLAALIDAGLLTAEEED